MYARVLRKWSLKTKRMSIKKWLTVVVVVTMLLLIICAPVTAAAAATLTANVAAAAATNADYNNKLLLQQQSPTIMKYHTRQLQDTAAVEIPAAGAAATAESLSASATFKYVFKKSSDAATTATRIPPNAGNVIEESFYIPVASQEDEERDSYTNNNNNNRAAIRNWQNVANNNRLINKLSSGSSSTSNNNNNNNNNIDNSNSSSSRSSNSKIFNSISRLSNSNNRQQQQQQKKGNEHQQKLPPPQPHSAAAYTDSLVYSYYYKTPISAPVLDRIKPQRQQHMNIVDENDNDDNDEQPEEEEEDDDDDDDEDDEEDLEEQGEFENEMKYTAIEKDIASVTSAMPTVYKQKVPNAKNSQIINILNNAYEYNKQKEEQQIQQIDANSHSMQQKDTVVATVPIYVRSIKARRHIQDQQHQQHSSATSQNYHSPVRETPASPSSHSSSVSAPSSSSLSLSATTVHKFSNNTATPLEHTTVVPYRYLIESLVLPLENSANLTKAQRQELSDEHERQRLKMQEQQPRNRRDSRAFGQMRNVAGGNTQQQIFGTQQQQFQRLQSQQQSTNLNNNNINKQQQQQSFQQHHNHNSHQHQHNHHQRQRQHFHQQQHQRQRKHPRRYCSARDPAQLAFEAPTVFEGKIISMTPNRRANFSATFEVKDTFKHQIGYRLEKYVRLQFAYRNTSGECDIYREQLRPRGLVRGDQLEQGRIYLMFVQQIGLGNFTILGQPIRKTRRVVEAVKNAVSENYAQLASIRSLTANKRVMESGQELRIICRVKGSPPPKVTWFKNDKSINSNRELYQFVHYKKRSELIIRSFNSSDAGRYECRAKNKVNRNLEHRTIMITPFKVTRYETSLTGGTGNNCPDDASEFCFNGGTCQFFPQIGSYSCICVEGFTGERCDSKEANNMPPNSTFKSGYIADDPNAH